MLKFLSRWWDRWVLRRRGWCTTHLVEKVGGNLGVLSAGPYCPECREEERLDMRGMRAYNKELKDTARRIARLKGKAC